MDAQDAKSSYGEYELPGGFVKNGIVYDHVSLKEITGEEEDILASESLSVTQKMDRLIANCMVSISTLEEIPVSEDGPKKEFTDKGQINNIVPKLTVGDRIFLLLALRRLSLGDTYLFKIACPNKECKNSFSQSLDLSTLPIVKMKDKKIRDYEITVPSGKKVKIRILTGEQEAELEKARKAVKDKMSLSLEVRVKEIDGEEATVEMLKKLSLKDRNFIRQSFDKNEGGVETTIDVRCPKCKMDFETDIDVGQSSFFFPSE